MLRLVWYIMGTFMVIACLYVGPEGFKSEAEFWLIFLVGLSCFVVGKYAYSRNQHLQ